MSETSTPPELGEVFISYSWDNEEHIRGKPNIRAASREVASQRWP